MPVNRNALIRYKTIDNCLRNRQRLWTLENLIEACSEALYDYEGIEKGVSRRTVQMDIQLMRSDKLGYHAPIVVIDKKYYSYENPDYSITNIPLTSQDLNKLTETVDFLKQFRGFSHFKDLESMVQKLEDQVQSQTTQRKPVIDFEKNENLKGLEFLNQLYQAITNKEVLNITYQSFKARQANTFDFHPYLLKEFKNRWFIIGLRQKREGLLNLALDRITGLDKSKKVFVDSNDFDPVNYFKHTIGVTVSPNLPPEKVKLFVTRNHAPYVQTKPFHSSQKTIEKSPFGITITLDVQLNFELEKEILGFGDGIKVIAPKRLKQNITNRLKGAQQLYDMCLSEDEISSVQKRLDQKGSTILNHIYNTKEIGKMSSLLHQFEKNNPKSANQVYAIRKLIAEIPELKNFIFNESLKNILSNLDSNLFLSKAIYFNKPALSNWYVTWHQDKTINVRERIDTEGFSGWTKKEQFYGVRPTIEFLQNTITVRIHLDDTDNENGALQVLAGSHKQILSDSEIKVITQSSIPKVCEVQTGGIHIMKPLLLHASSKTTSSRNRRVIHLEFNSMGLLNGLELAERLVFT